jgi:ATP-dependent helicase YprA (DUF1998 family)
MLPFNRERVLVNVRNATTEDLLDRVTAYRAGMEPEALDLIEAELRDRGVTAAQIEAHAEGRRREGVLLSEDVAARCSFCDRPAVVSAWGWQRLGRLVPLFPRVFRYCAEHRPR